MKKPLVLALLLSAGTLAYADNSGAEAFAAGFANALNRSMGGQPYQPPAQTQVNVNADVYLPHDRGPHVDAVKGDNTLGGYYFFNASECFRFLHRTGYSSGYTDCREIY